MSYERAIEVGRASVMPGLARLAPYGVSGGAAAARVLLAVGEQESGLTARRQAGGGSARGLWQFERAGVAGVVTHPWTQGIVSRLSDDFGVHGVDEIWFRIAHDDVLAACVARLALYTDVRQIALGCDAAWLMYRRVWRPGKPAKERWAGSWAVATRAWADVLGPEDQSSLLGELVGTGASA